MCRSLPRALLFVALSVSLAMPAIAKAPRAAFPSPCLGGCFDTYQKCVRGYGSEAACASDYSRCIGACDRLGTGGPLPEALPRVEPKNFGNTPVGQTGRDIFRIYNNVSRATIKRPKATLYASWTPPEKDNLGLVSNPVNGPYALSYGYRWELKAGEGQNVAVDFKPFEPGKRSARLYLWWDSYTHFSWVAVYDYSGTGVIPPATAPSFGAPSPGVTTGQRGGLETVPLWLATDAGDRYRPPLWQNLNTKKSNANAVPMARRRSVNPGKRVSIPLLDVIPATYGALTPILREPEAVIGGSNAVESLAADYVDPATNTIEAVVLAFRTRNDVYAHVYPVCARVKGAWLEGVEFPSVTVPGSNTPATFWQSKMNTPDDEGTQTHEVATSFAVYTAASGKSFTVDSQWLAEQYQRHKEPDGEILTFQVWSPKAETTAALRTAILERFRTLGSIDYRNIAAITRPDVFLASGDYGYDNATLFVENQSSTDRAMTIDAVTWSAANSRSRADFHYTYTVPPGRTALIIPMAGRLNGVIYASANGSNFTDMIYFADGSWFSFGESGPPDWTAPDCPAQHLGVNDLAAAGCARLVTAIPNDGWRGIGRSFSTYTRDAIDIADMSGISFFARGPARTVELQIGAYNAEGQRVVHHAFFTPSETGRQLTIPFDWLEGVNEAHDTEFNGARVIDVAWNYAGAPHASSDLTIGNVFFTADLVAEAAASTPSVPAVGEVPVGARFATAEETASAALLYRRAGEADFIRIPLRQMFDLFGGEIPAQPMGTRVEYYYEFSDGTGRASTLPPDAPNDTYSLIFSMQPVMLLDDFNDALISNRRGGAATTFHSDSGGIGATHDGSNLRITYDVSTRDSFSGWVSAFREPIDTSLYDSITLRVRGDRGGERIKLGLADSAGREHKLLLGKHLPGGLGTDWRDVQIPLAAFPTIDLKTLRKLIVVFENHAGSGAGAIEVDEITLRSSGTSLPLLIDNFDDRSTENALGGNLYAATGGTATLSATHNAGAYRITANGTNGSWSTAGFDLRGVNASTVRNLALSLHGARGGEVVHVYLASGDTRKFVPITVTNNWQRHAIALSAFAEQGVNLSKLDRLELVWEYRDFSNETIHVDDVALEP